ncbi:MAG: hypothetical protein LH628_19045 [Microcoleus sp. CAN_BIN18]|nr:hypothetical protein [Microcoleus sp. CAN_BIN18]
MLKEQLVSLLNPLAYILHSLRTYRLPERITLSQFGDMSLKFGATQMLFEHPIVPFMQRNTVVIDHPSSVDLSLQVSISLVLIKLKLQCFHAIIVAY